MRLHAGQQRFILWALAAAVVALALTSLILLRLGLYYWNASDYPGADQFGKNYLYKITPQVELRQDAAYHSNDPFPAIYNYYSSGFRLGPEARAQGACIEMMKASRFAWVIERDMSVTLCDTPKGRMIFVTRIFSLSLH